jgi:hypothetical protein
VTVLRELINAVLFFLLAISGGVLGFAAWQISGAFLGAIAGASAWLVCKYTHKLEWLGPWLMLPVAVAFSFGLMDVLQHFGHEVGAFTAMAALGGGGLVWLALSRLMPQPPKESAPANS